MNREKPSPYPNVPRPIEPRVFYGFKLINRTAPLNNRSNDFWLDAHGVVRCGFKKSGISRCGSVRFSDIVNPTLRFGAVMCPTVRFGAVLKISKSYGAVRCVFERSTMNGTVRFGFFMYPTDAVRFGAVVRNKESYGAVWCVR